MRSVMKHRFSEVPSVEIPRSKFNRNHGYKTTLDAAYLCPIFIDWAVPGDTFKLNMHAIARLATPIYPIMDNMFLDTFFFAVPIRLLWSNFKKFCGEQVDPGDSIAYTIPQVTLNNVANESLYDYFGLPTKIAANYTVNNLDGRCYNLIWNEWFRDENLQDSAVVDLDDGPDNPADYVLLKRGKRHDYFTSCLPFLQKGDAVELSLGVSAPVTGLGVENTSWTTGPFSVYETDKTGTVSYATYKNLSNDTTNQRLLGEEDPNNSGYPNFRADLANATASTVNELRQAIQIQRLLERDARSGTRYTEIVKSFFGVTSDDARLQRPEYLGGGSQQVNVSAIARTDSSPGELGAMGVSRISNHGFVKSFTEHCVVMGLCNIRADLTYQEGIERRYDYQTRYDFYWPTLAHIGEMAVLNREIYLDAATLGAGTDQDVFGYQERYADMRYKKSIITGKMRSNDAASLDAWHLGIEFGSLPTLDDTFIQDDPPIDRVIATPTEPHFIMDCYFEYECARPMPTYSIPGLMDHF